MSVLISCEVGGNLVPPQLPALSRVAAATKSAQRSKRTTRKTKRSPAETIDGPDVTALYVARRMSENLRAPLIANDNASQLIDVRRSLRNRQLFSGVTRDWPVTDRQRLIETIYLPYRARLRTQLSRMLSRSTYVIHLSLQSFPLGEGKRRCRADMGLLYDPAEQDEVDFCLDWIDELYEELEMLRVRRNYPQRGTRDSITKAMRGEFKGENYLGIEMMINQAWAAREIAVRDQVIDGICWSLQTVLEIPQSKAA